MTDSERFSELLSLPAEKMQVSAGVGTLGEKYLHALLKNFFEPNKNCHEVKVGRFTADICRDKEIIEIQTRSLDRLREKLEYYLLEGYSVTVVYPIPHTKWLSWVDPDTGDTTKKRRSGKVGSIYDCFRELYKIKYFLDWKDLTVKLVLIDVEDYKSLDGYGPKRKRRANRIDRIPVALYDTVTLSSPQDYIMFLPEGLSCTFTAQDYAKAIKRTVDYSRYGLNILGYLGIIEDAGKDGRKKLYKISEVVYEDKNQGT